MLTSCTRLTLVGQVSHLLGSPQSTMLPLLGCGGLTLSVCVDNFAELRDLLRAIIYLKKLSILPLAASQQPHLRLLKFPVE